MSFNLEISKIPLFYKEIVEVWSEFSFQKTDTNSTFHWNHYGIIVISELIDTLLIREFHLAGINKVGDLVNLMVNLKVLINYPKIICQKMYFKWMQLIDAILSHWKQSLMLHDQLTEKVQPQSLSF